MQYFNTLPSIAQLDPYGNTLLVTNLLSRAYLLPSLQNNIYLFYQYDIKIGDTPENISYRYYNDLNRYWMIMYANGITDPQWGWPVDDNTFLAYLMDKYTDVVANTYNVSTSNVTSSMVLGYTQATVYNYNQTITTYDTTSTQKQTITIQVDESTYNQISPSTKSISFTNGIVATKITDKSTQSIYDYEISINESKRTINLIKSQYAKSVENQLQTLMSK